MSELDWSRLYKARRETARRFGELWSLPIARRYSTVLLEAVQPGQTVLEVGAGDRSLQDKLNVLSNVTYRSCDIDSSYSHDFTHIDEVDIACDVVCGFEVIEHLSLAEALHLLLKCREVLGDDGVLCLTTPNIYYPPAFLRDATHVTPFAYDELGGLVAMAGFRVEAIYRLYHDSLLKRLFRRVLCYPIFRILGIDFARQIMVVARTASPQT